MAEDHRGGEDEIANAAMGPVVHIGSADSDGGHLNQHVCNKRKAKGRNRVRLCLGLFVCLFFVFVKSVIGLTSIETAKESTIKSTFF